MDDSDITRLLTEAGVPASPRCMALIRIFASAPQCHTLEDIYRAMLRIDSDTNFVGVGRSVNRLWLAGLLERGITPRKSGRSKAIFSAPHLRERARQPTADPQPQT